MDALPRRPRRRARARGEARARHRASAPATHDRGRGRARTTEGRRGSGRSTSGASRRAATDVPCGHRRTSKLREAELAAERAALRARKAEAEAEAEAGHGSGESRRRAVRVRAHSRRWRQGCADKPSGSWRSRRHNRGRGATLTRGGRTIRRRPSPVEVRMDGEAHQEATPDAGKNGGRITFEVGRSRLDCRLPHANKPAGVGRACGRGGSDRRRRPRRQDAARPARAGGAEMRQTRPPRASGRQAKSNPSGSRRRTRGCEEGSLGGQHRGGRGSWSRPAGPR